MHQFRWAQVNYCIDLKFFFLILFKILKRETFINSFSKEVVTNYVSAKLTGRCVLGDTLNTLVTIFYL